MNETFACFIVLTFLVAYGYCTVLASTGYVLSNPRVRNVLIKTGLANALSHKASALYEVSNFRYAFDQGTDIRKAEMNSHDIVEIDPKKLQKRVSSLPNYTKEEDRIYSEKLFTVLHDMDKNACVSRLLCEIGADPKSFGIMGLKINHYLKSVPPVTWNSATFPYMEAFQGGLSDSKSACSQHYATCRYDLRRVMKFLWLFMKPVKMASVF